MNDVRVPLLVGDDPPSARLLYGVGVLDGIRHVPDGSVHCVVTSPPYWGLRDYGTEPVVWGGSAGCAHRWGAQIEVSAASKGHAGDKSTLEGTQTAEQSKSATDLGAFCKECGAWRGHLGLEPDPDLYVAHIVSVFREVKRVLRPEGTLWVNLGDTYCSQSGSRVYGSSDGDAGRPSGTGLKPKDLAGIPWRVALALQADGWWLRNDIVWQKENHLPSPVQDRFACSYEHIFLLAQRERYFFDLDAVRVPHSSVTYLEGGGFVPPQNWYEKGEGHRKMDQTEGQLGTNAGPPRRVGRGLYNPRGKNPGDILSMPTQPFPGTHFAVFPEALPERCIRAGTSEHGCCATCGAPWVRVRGGAEPVEGRGSGIVNPKTNHQPEGRSGMRTSIPWNPTARATVGWEPTCTCGTGATRRATVLDPFCGSGTTGRVALRLNRDFVGVDLNDGYLPMAVARIRDEPPPDGPVPPEEGSVLDVFDPGGS